MKKKLNMKLSEEFLNGFTKALLQNKRVRVHPFGVFFLRTRKARKGYDFETGEATRQFPEVRYVHFKNGKWLQRAIDRYKK